MIAIGITCEEEFEALKKAASELAEYCKFQTRMVKMQLHNQNLKPVERENLRKRNVELVELELMKNMLCKKVSEIQAAIDSGECGGFEDEERTIIIC